MLSLQLITHSSVSFGSCDQSLQIIHVHVDLHVDFPVPHVHVHVDFPVPHVHVHVDFPVPHVHVHACRKPRKPSQLCMGRGLLGRESLLTGRDRTWVQPRRM